MGVFCQADLCCLGKKILLRFAGWMRLRTQEDAGIRIQQCDAEGSNKTKLKTKKWSEIEKQLGKLKVTAMDSMRETYYDWN